MRRILTLCHRLVEQFRVESRIVERVPPAPVRQRELGGHPDVLLAHRISSAPGGVGNRGARHHQIGTHAVDVKRRAQCRDAP